MRAAASTSSSQGPEREVHDLAGLLSAIDDRVSGSGAAAALSVEDILALVGRRAYGPLLLIIGLVSISPAALIPGSTWLFATLSLVVATQLALHKRTPWLPAAALRTKLSAEKLRRFVKAAKPTAKVVDKIVRPRLTFFAEPPWVILVALLCVIAALMTYPLSFVPLAPFAPGLAIALFGLGITARDGALLMISIGVLGFAGWFFAGRIF